MKLNHLFPLIICLMTLSCGSKPTSKSNFVISLGALVSASFPGGAVLRINDPATGVYKDYDLVAPYRVVVPFGKWDFQFIGFPGPSAWQGTPECGSAMDTEILTPESTVSISANSGACSAEPFASIITAKTTQTLNWDAPGKNWDDAGLTWGP